MISVSPLVRCPSCRYSLRGLPSAHQCPECGLEYDDRTIVFSPLQPWRPFVGEGISMMLVTLVIMPQSVRAAAALFGPSWSTFFWLAIYIWPALLGLRMLRAHRRRNVVVIDASGIEVRSAGKQERFAWNDVTWRDPMMRYRIVGSGGPKPVSVRGVFETKIETARFDQIVRTLTTPPCSVEEYALRWVAKWPRWVSWESGSVLKAPSNWAFYSIAAAFLLIILNLGLSVILRGMISKGALAVIGALSSIAVVVLVLANQWFGDPRLHKKEGEDEEVG